MITLPAGTDLVALAQRAYSLSRPQGLGFLHYQEGGLPAEDAKGCIGRDGSLNMDYVHGRALKFHVQKNADGSFSLADAWYDHTTEQYQELLEPFGVSVPKAEHGASCNCSSCRNK